MEEHEEETNTVLLKDIFTMPDGKTIRGSVLLTIQADGRLTYREIKEDTDGTGETTNNE